MSGKSLQLNFRGETQPAECPVFIGDGLQAQLFEWIEEQQFSQIMVVSDSNVAPIWGERFTRWLDDRCTFAVVPAGDESKSLKYAEHVWSQCKCMECDRNSLVLSLGGGMITDLAGFCASSYLRGISFVHVPTSLLAQVDASIGSKVGINFEGAKNLVGAFANPQAVFVDTQFLSTLPEREYRSGFAEIVKHAAALDTEYFTLLESLPECVGLTPEQEQDLIARSIELKMRVVQADHFESGRRRVLNFGHTIGHALESLAILRSQTVLHGEAVARGMLIEAKIAVELGMLAEPAFDRLQVLLKRFKLLEPLPFSLVTEDLVGALVFDKKRSFDKVKWSLIDAIGSSRDGIDCETDLVSTAIEKCLSL